MILSGAPPAQPRRILIYRLGSIGDTMVALPALKLVARRFPDAERVLLTGEAPHNGASMATLLAGSGLVHRHIEYRPKERRPFVLLSLLRRIRALRADLLVYLTEPKGAVAIWRDVAFFRACGIRRIVGAPLSLDRRRHGPPSDGRGPDGGGPEPGIRESEAARLARCIAELGDARLDAPESWEPPLDDTERAEADRILRAWNGGAPFVAMAVGMRAPVKDWGEDRWAELIGLFEARHPDIGVMLVGGPLDRSRAGRLAADRNIPVLDRCGGDLRVTMALLRRARLAVATDGGPMHMAAGLGVPVVAVFSGTNPPGIWFPAGEGHTVFYRSPPCSGCGPRACAGHGGACIRSVSAGAVFGACSARLDSAGAPGGRDLRDRGA